MELSPHSACEQGEELQDLINAFTKFAEDYINSSANFVCEGAISACEGFSACEEFKINDDFNYIDLSSDDNDLKYKLQNELINNLKNKLDKDI